MDKATVWKRYREIARKDAELRATAGSLAHLLREYDLADTFFALDPNIMELYERIEEKFGPEPKEN